MRTIDYPPCDQIRRRLNIGNGLEIATERMYHIGSIQPADGRFGGTLWFRSPNCWSEFEINTVWNHVNIPNYVRCGPASWASIRITSGCDIMARFPAQMDLLVDQQTGLISTTGVVPSEEDIQAMYWFEPDVAARTPLETLPIVGDVVPPADLEPVAAATTIRVGYTPRLTRFAMVSCPARLFVSASYPPAALAPHGLKQISGPNDGDTSFYLGPWSELGLQNLDPENAAKFKVVWSEEPGGND